MTEKHSSTILVIDDETPIRESLVEYFVDYGFSTRAASSAEEGLKLLEEYAFKLAVVDIRLPGINGIQFIHTAHQLYPALKYIIHTGSVHFRISSDLSIFGVGESDVFLKPVFNLELMLDRAKALLSPEVPR